MTKQLQLIKVPGRSGRGRAGLALSFGLLLAACAPKGEALYQRAAGSLAEGKVGAAVIDLKNLVEAEPQNAKARALLATASLRAGDVQTAEIEIRKAMDLGAPADVALGTYCRVLASKGETDKVLAECDAAKVKDAARAEVLIARGDALLQSGRAGDAKLEFQAAAAAQPDSLDAMLGLATVAAQSGDIAGAVKLFDGASAAAKETSRYWFAMGGLRSGLSDYPAAEKAYQTAVKKAESSGAGNERLAALAGLAESQLRQSKFKEAKATGALIAKAAPDNLYFKVVRAQIATLAGDYEEARMLLETVLAKQPASVPARTLLGIVNLRQGNLGQAEMNFANVVANDPSNVQAQRLLAETRSQVQTPQQTLDGLKPALELNPDPSLLAMAGRLSVASGDKKQAVAYLSQATSKSDGRLAPDVQLEVASGFLSAGEYDRAIELLRTMPRSAAGSGYQREYLLISALLRKGDKDGAVAEAKALLEATGNDPSVKNLVAGAYAAAGNPQAGREQLQQALEAKPDDVTSLLNLARLDLAEGKSAAAEAGFRKVLEIEPKNLAATTGAALAAGASGDRAGAERWLLKAATDHPDSTEATAALAQFYIAGGNLPKAKALLDEAVKKSPNNAAYANMRGLVLLAGRDGPGAIHSFNEAARLAPGEAEYTMNLARAKLVTGDAPGALNVMDGFLSENPRHALALQLAATLALQGGQIEKAAGYVERLHDVAPDSGASVRLDGDLAMAQKRYKDALAAYRKAGANGKDSALVLAEYSAGRLAGIPDAMKVLEEWIAAHPEDGRAVSIVAEAKRASGNLDAAVALYEQGIAKDPRDPVMLNNLAVIYQEKGDPRAVETGRRAYNLAPNSPPFMDTYGWILVDAGKLDDAVRLLKSASDGAPESGEIRYHYAAALAKAGRADEARAELQKALGGELPPAVRTDAQKLLKQLSK